MDTERAKVIDELGTIQKRLLPYVKDIKREKTLKDKIRTWPVTDKVPAEATKAYQGSKYCVTVGICGEKRTWKATAKAALFALLKKPAFLTLCNVTFEKASEAVGEATVADLVLTERTGTRPLIVAEKS